MRLANNHEIKEAVVFNAEEIELPDDCAHSEIEDIQLHTLSHERCSRGSLCLDGSGAGPHASGIDMRVRSALTSLQLALKGFSVRDELP